MNWTLEKIKTKVRSLTGRTSTEELSEADLLDSINNYYVYNLPVDLDINELDSFFEMTTSAGVGDVALDSDMLSITNPITLDGDAIKLYMDVGYFFELYPRSDEGSDTYDEPVACLVYDRSFYIRPIPDAVYTIKAAVKKRPTALAEDTDRPLNDKWGPIIAYGASVQILLDNGETSEAEILSSVGMSLVGKSNRESLLMHLGNRSVPRF